jgi:hypothetical protein
MAYERVVTPHGGATWPNSKRIDQSQFAGITEEVERTATWEKCCEFLWRRVSHQGSLRGTSAVLTDGTTLAEVRRDDRFPESVTVSAKMQ